MPRAGITRERIIEEAARVADDVGLERLTLSAVAKAFGVSLPSLYKHIDSLEGLRRDLALLGVRQLTAALAAASVGKARGDALHAIARTYRQFAKAHPGLEAAAVRAPRAGDAEHEAAGEAAIATLLAALAGYQLRRRDAIDAIRMLRAALHGFVTLELAGGYELPQPVSTTYGRLIDGLDGIFSSWGAALNEVADGVPPHRLRD
ncbi:MAG TPA: WHG domain-containing protein [Ktedonobacterales bacterium]